MKEDTKIYKWNICKNIYKWKHQGSGTSLVVQNLPSDTGHLCSISGQGTKIPHAMEQLSPHATTKTQCSQK